MGKGDRKTAKGKRYTSSYGNVRPHDVVTEKPAIVKKAAPVATKAPAKKAAPVKKKAS